MHKKNSLLGLVLLLACLLTACKTTPVPVGGTYVWIDVPIDGLSFPLGEAVHIEGHTSSDTGIDEVEIYVNGDLLTTISEFSTKGNLAHFETLWTPPAEGEYVIHASASDSDGMTSNPDSVAIRVGEGEVTRPNTYTPTHTGTPTLATITLTPTTPTVVITSVTPPLTNTPTPTPTWTFTFPPPTATFTPIPPTDTFTPIPPTSTFTPIPDTQGPPPPKTGGPSGGTILGCSSQATLTWGASSDPSGIAEYRVEVQKSYDNASWTPHTNSPWTGLSATSLTIPVECAWYYQWRVMAVDGAGNPGAYSGWAQFAVTLE